MRTTLLAVFCSFFLTPLKAASLGQLHLPEVAQGSDVHTLSTTYCRVLWKSVMQSAEYTPATIPGFKDTFNISIEELGKLILNIKSGQPILVEGKINTMSEPIVDPDLLSDCEFFDPSASSQLMVALKSMSVLGKHKGGSDIDGETNGRVNEIFVYTWGKVKANPAVYLPAFLVGLVDAASTCIQGYSVRMLCAVHPPKLKVGATKK